MATEVNIGVNANVKDASVKLEKFASDGQSAFKRISESATQSQQAALTWTQFLKGRMGPAMKKAMEDGATHADAHRVAMGRLSAQWKEYKRTVVSANKAVASSTRKSLATTQKRISAFKRLKVTAGNYVKKLFTLKGLLISYGAIRFGRILLRSIADIEEGWIEVVKRTGLAGAKLETFKEKIRDLSIELKGVKLEELQNIAAVGGQLGIAAKDLPEFTRVISMVGVATNLSSEEAAQGLAKLGNVLGEPIAKLEKISSVMNILSNNSTASSSELVDFVKITGTMGKTLGLTTPEIFALGATMKDMGLNTEVAGTAILQVFSKIITNTADFAREAGVPVKEFTALVKDNPIEAIKLLSKALSEMDKFTAVQALSNLGLEGRRVLQTMLGLAKGTEKLETSLARANSEYKIGKSLQKEYSAASKTLISAATSTANAFKILGEQLGEVFLPPMKLLLPLITKGALAFRDFGQGLGGFAAWLVGFDVSADPVPRTLENITNEIGILQKAIKTLVDAPGQGAADGVKRLTGFLDVALKKQKELLAKEEKKKAPKAAPDKAPGAKPSDSPDAKGITDITAAFETLNIDSTAQLIDMANKAVAAFLTIKDSGVATPEDILRAYKAASAGINAILDDLKGKQGQKVEAPNSDPIKFADDLIAASKRGFSAIKEFQDKRQKEWDNYWKSKKFSEAPSSDIQAVEDRLKDLSSAFNGISTGKTFSPIVKVDGIEDALAGVKSLKAELTGLTAPVVIPIKGQGSAVLPISEKINDIKTMFGSISQVRPTVTADFSAVTAGISNVQNSLDTPDLLSFLDSQVVKSEISRQLATSGLSSFEIGKQLFTQTVSGARSGGGVTRMDVTVNINGSKSPHETAMETRDELLRLNERV